MKTVFVLLLLPALATAVCDVDSMDATTICSHFAARGYCTMYQHVEMMAMECPYACGACELSGGACAINRDEKISQLAATVGYTAMGCSDAVSQVSCNDEMYGRYLWQYCPCACHDELMLQAESGYSYDMNAANGPHNWGDDCQAGGEQSPIDIDTMTSFGLSNVALVRSWDTTSPTGGSFELYNAGHSVVIGLSGSLQASNLPFINRPYLTDKDYTFNLAHVHFHWGSEHTLNGYRYPLEAHFVHVNAAYASVEEALGFSDGLLVVGVFYHLAAAGEQESASLASAGFASQAADLDGNNYPLGDFDPNELVPSNLEYYSYAGGLTTPPCSRVVTWVVASQSLPVSNATLTNFLMTKDSHGHYVAEHGNYRPVQPLAGRGLVQYTSMP